MEDVLWEIERVLTKRQLAFGIALSAVAAYVSLDNLAPSGSPVLSALFALVLFVVGIVFVGSHRRHAIRLTPERLSIDGATYELGAIEMVRFRWVLEPWLVIKGVGIHQGYGIGWLTKAERAEFEVLLKRHIAANK